MFTSKVKNYNHIELRGDSIPEVVCKLLRKNAVVYFNERALEDDFSSIEKKEVLTDDVPKDKVGYLVAKCSKPDDVFVMHHKYPDAQVITYGVNTGFTLSKGGYCKAICKDGKIIGMSKTR